jgi:hypothetical protein
MFVCAAVQFWSIPFWHCSVGICRDASTDDMGFIEQVIADLPKRLPLKPGHVSHLSVTGSLREPLALEWAQTPRVGDSSVFTYQHQQGCVLHPWHVPGSLYVMSESC